ncbi:Beta-1,4-mannooligosaccharide phosphorylase [Posidoniimonas corsicana]|uniref:Beta-1,4-mannooligosaccharide phosphorylase n=1 Tax=Posidoniimonas corsicana TaxID=1938618 RepID=A0A5C5V712_9BACT|nr:glycoside hydrolase family 130 protein [Posidoniimonas corsicana]TWT33870.1 Beta-1,4-mannooligosaccharide phosphorylase [Posidoniimonas corsicana]
MTSADEVAPLTHGFEVIGVFNPGVVRTGDRIMLLARVAERPKPGHPGRIGMPRIEQGGKVTVDWEPESEFDLSDPRVVRALNNGQSRLTSISHLRVFHRNEDGPGTWSADLVLLPESPTEEYGVEDPRITTIDSAHWVTYVAVSRHGAVTALASTRDFIDFARHGVIFPPENKDVVLFPRKIGDEYVALHRPTARTDFCRPEIWLAPSPDLLNWGAHEPLLSGIGGWDNQRIGAGAPPIETDDGWLVLYHGCGSSGEIGQIGAYCGAAVLLDRDDPTRVLRRSLEPLLRPLADFECSGFVPNVVFPTALIDAGPTLAVYYGAADEAIGVVNLSRDSVLDSLQ